MILITTSRKPGRRTRSFCKDLSRSLPHSKYVNRGKGSIWDITHLALSQGFSRVLVVGETKGNPSLIRTIEVGKEPRWGIQIYIGGVRLCREIGCSLQEGDYIEVRGDEFEEPLRTAFSYPISEGEPVLLEEIEGKVRFLFDGELVGPTFRVIGWDRVPEGLRRQSSLKR